MSDDGIKINYARLDEALARALTQSKREPVVYMKEQARGVVRRVVGITPPASITSSNFKDETGADVWHVVQGGAAKRQGERTVISDIAKIYGTRAGAVQVIKEHETHKGMVKGFVKYISSGELPRAQELFRYATSKGLIKFDDGALHRSRRNARGRVGRINGPLVYVSNDDLLKAYIKKMQSMVGFLAAGWNQACAMLGIQPPPWIWRHNAPGTGSVEITPTRITIRMVNQVGYAGEIPDFQRRVQFAVDAQADAIRRRSQKFMQNLFNDPQFKLKAFAA